MHSYSKRNLKPSMEEDFQNGDDLQQQALVWKHILAVVDSMMIKCAVKLRLFDAIFSHSSSSSSSAISLSNLATALSIPSSRVISLRRIIRYLSRMRLIEIRPTGDGDGEGEGYALTAAASTYLREGSEKSHAAFVRVFLEEDALISLHGFDTYLLDDGAKDAVPFERSGSFEEFFEWTNRTSGRFSEGMACTARPIAEAFLKGCPTMLEGIKSLVDVGGGSGILAAAIAETFPGINCVVYDLPFAANGAPDYQRVLHQSGDMFVSVPNADAALLMRVLHDWNDVKALTILRRCREAIAAENGRVIILEVILDENDDEDVQHIKLAYDILLMAYTGGKERTEKEWRSLLLQAGFSRCTIVRLFALQYAIEARI